MWKSSSLLVLLSLVLISPPLFAQEKKYCDCDFTTFPGPAPVIVPVEEEKKTTVIFAWCVPGCYGKNPAGALENYRESEKELGAQSTRAIHYNGTVRSFEIVIPHEYPQE